MHSDESRVLTALCRRFLRQQQTILLFFIHEHKQLESSSVNVYPAVLRLRCDRQTCFYYSYANTEVGSRERNVPSGDVVSFIETSRTSKSKPLILELRTISHYRNYRNNFTNEREGSGKEKKKDEIDLSFREDHLEKIDSHRMHIFLKITRNGVVDRWSGRL